MSAVKHRLPSNASKEPPIDPPPPQKPPGAPQGGLLGYAREGATTKTQILVLNIELKRLENLLILTDFIY